MSHILSEYSREASLDTLTRWALGFALSKLLDMSHGLLLSPLNHLLGRGCVFGVNVRKEKRYLEDVLCVA